MMPFSIYVLFFLIISEFSHAQIWDIQYEKFKEERQDVLLLLLLMLLFVVALLIVVVVLIANGLGGVFVFELHFINHPFFLIIG